MAEKMVLLSTVAAMKSPPEVRPLVDEVDLAALPKRLDRRAGAELITRHFFPISPRTIEAWPLVVRRMNGKALYETADLVAFARAKVAQAPAIRGGRRSGNAAS